MDIFNIIQVRDTYFSRTTIGEIKLLDRHFCWTLEDTVRAYGIKVKGDTAIPNSPAIGYSVGIRFSPGFNRDMLILHTGDGETLDFGGISFKYIYPHGGNDHGDTEGCILVAKNKNGDTIQGTMEKALFDKIAPLIKAGVNVRWHIRNKT